MSHNWLPSEENWLSEVASKVEEGKIILLKALPKWGLSSVSQTISELLGSTSVRIDGKKFSENNEFFTSNMSDSLSRIAESRGYAQLIFDNFGHAMENPGSGHLHSRLFSLLVDSLDAAATGALLISRFEDRMDQDYYGSPLLSRAESIALPKLNEADAKSIGMDLESARERYGDGTWLARRVLSMGIQNGESTCHDMIYNGKARFRESIPHGAIQVCTGEKQILEADPASRECLSLLGTSDRGDFEFSSIVKGAGLSDSILNDSAVWPDSYASSVENFAKLIGKSNDILWVDRYLCQDPLLVSSFLQSLRTLTGAKIRLLTSMIGRPGNPSVSDVANAIAPVENIEIRKMRGNDYIDLHDRHLILEDVNIGFSIPTSRVIFSVDPSGTACETRLRRIPPTYKDYWNRGEPIFSN